MSVPEPRPDTDSPSLETPDAAPPATSHPSDSTPADTAQPGDPAPLSPRDRAVLAFEHNTWRDSAAKEQAIRLEFDLSPARYYQILNALIDSPVATVYDPMLVRRLQRVREARTTERSARIPLIDLPRAN